MAEMDETVALLLQSRMEALEIVHNQQEMKKREVEEVNELIARARKTEQGRQNVAIILEEAQKIQSKKGFVMQEKAKKEARELQKLFDYEANIVQKSKNLRKKFDVSRARREAAGGGFETMPMAGHNWKSLDELVDFIEGPSGPTGETKSVAGKGKKKAQKKTVTKRVEEAANETE